MFASRGEMMLPCGVPLSGMIVEPSGIRIGAARIRFITNINCLSLIPSDYICDVPVVCSCRVAPTVRLDIAVGEQNIIPA